MTSIIRSLSTLQANTAGRRIVERTRGELEIASKELSTGFRADVAKDLGMRSSQSILLRGLMDRTDQFVQGNKLVENKFEMLADATNTFQDEAQNFLNLAVGNKLSPTPTVGVLQAEAKATIDALSSYLNSNFNGEFLFSGIDSNKKTMNEYDEVNPDTGFSPAGVVDGIVAGGPMSTADAAAKIAELDTIFDSSNTVNPERNFEGTFFAGTPKLDAGGNPNPRQTAVVTDTKKIDYGIQANDPAFTEVFKGLSMLASTDVSEINDPEAYKAWMAEAVNSIAGGIKKINESQASLGKQQELLDGIVTNQQDQKDIYNNRIVALEGVDPYEAATRMSALQTQLDATYATTARLSKLSFLNYM